MKFKKLILSIVLATSSMGVFADSGSVVLGIIIGSAITANQRDYPRDNSREYQQNRYPQQIIINSQPQYESDLRGYCTPYRDEQYSECIGNIRRHKNEEYRRGYR